METAFARIEAATAGLDPPLAAVDLEGFDLNAADMARRAGGRRIRVASKSVRCRSLLRRVLARPGYGGVLAYALPEAVWLAGGNSGDGGNGGNGGVGGNGGDGGNGGNSAVSDDVLVAYPSADRGAIARLAGSEPAARAVTLMIDSVDQLDLIDAVVPPDHRPPLRVCLDVDASLRLLGGRVHLGTLRSPVCSPREAAALARCVASRPGFRLVGLMAYEGQIAGVGDDPPGRRWRAAAVRGMQTVSGVELRRRRRAVVMAVRDVAPLEFVNGGGTGSLERTAAEPWVSELAAGSGLYGPTLFDTYRAFTPHPAAVFALPVVRRPGPGVVTVYSGGWPASGPPGTDRLPVPVHPPGLRLTATESAGEVQTPLVGEAADRLRPGERVWFRHAKAGELCERVDQLYLVDAEGPAEPVPTYRGEGRCFG